MTMKLSIGERKGGVKMVHTNLVLGLQFPSQENLNKKLKDLGVLSVRLHAAALPGHPVFTSGASPQSRSGSQSI